MEESLVDVIVEFEKAVIPFEFCIDSFVTYCTDNGDHKLSITIARMEEFYTEGTLSILLTKLETLVKPLGFKVKSSEKYHDFGRFVDNEKKEYKLSITFLRNISASD